VKKEKGYIRAVAASVSVLLSCSSTVGNASSRVEFDGYVNSVWETEPFFPSYIGLGASAKFISGLGVFIDGYHYRPLGDCLCDVPAVEIQQDDSGEWSYIHLFRLTGYSNILDVDYYYMFIVDDISAPVPDGHGRIVDDSGEGGISFTYIDVLHRGDAAFGITPYRVTVGEVPEPASWGMMLTGFGLIGGAMRHCRKKLVSFAWCAVGMGAE